MTKQIPPWVLLIGGLFVIRLYTLTLSGFGWYHGFNEAVYTEIAQGYNSNPFLPTRRGAAFFDTGPLTTYLMWASHSILGVSAASSRLPSLLAYPVAVWAAYRAAEGFYGPGKGKIAALLVGTAPWVLLWFGRAQTDAWMTAGVLLLLAGIAKPEGKVGAFCIAGGLAIGILSKQPALLLAPFIFLFVTPVRKAYATKASYGGKEYWQIPVLHSWMKYRVWILTATGLAIGLSWWLVMRLLYPEAMSSAGEFHTTRAAFGENFAWTLVLGLIMGSGGILFFSWLARKEPNPLLLVGVGGYTLFALLNSPVGHEYYALPAVAILGVVASNWKWTTPTLSAAVAVSLLLTVPILAYAGDLDDRQAEHMGLHIAGLDGNVTSPERLVPQLELYSGRRVLYSEELNQSEGAFMVSWDSLPCPELAKTPSTFKNPPLRLFDCNVRSRDVSETVDPGVMFVPEALVDYPARTIVEARLD